jgi:hypothetical protein
VPNCGAGVTAADIAVCLSCATVEVDTLTKTAAFALFTSVFITSLVSQLSNILVRDVSNFMTTLD